MCDHAVPNFLQQLYEDYLRHIMKAKGEYYIYITA